MSVNPGHDNMRGLSLSTGFYKGHNIPTLYAHIWIFYYCVIIISVFLCVYICGLFSQVCLLTLAGINNILVFFYLVLCIYINCISV